MLWRNWRIKSQSFWRDKDDSLERNVCQRPTIRCLLGRHSWWNLLCFSQGISQTFGVSVNEILSGQRLAEEDYKQAVEENLTQAIKSSSFTLRDRIEFYKRKWLKDHVAIMVFLGICILGVAATGCFLKNAWIGYGAFLLLIIAHCWRNNAMMTYVENNAYDGKGNA